jgi:hypothetical protein
MRNGKLTITEAPRGSMKQVDHWIGFWGDVEIE